MTENSEVRVQGSGPYTVVRIVGIIALLTALAAILFAYSQALLYWNDIHV